jgi:4-hydroxy-tetrahydrodipicolinate synthase
LRLEARYMIRQGVHGLVGGGSAGEGFALSRDELRRVVAVIAEEAAGQLPVFAGIIANSTREAIARAKAVADCGVSALQVTPVHYIYKSDDGAMVRHFQALYEAVGIPIIVYNVIPWNYLSPALLLRLMRDVPGVVGVKQSAGDMKLLADLLLSAEPQNRIYAALDALVYPTLALGAHGVISQILAAIPGPCVQLWNAVQRKDHAAALRLHRQMLTLWNAIAGDNRLAVTKYTLSLQGIPTGPPRAPLTPASPAQQQAARQALAALIGQENVHEPG